MRGILVVSFGTTHIDTRKKTIEILEQEIAKKFPKDKIYRAWTSKMIIQKVEKQEGIKVYNVKEAMEIMKNDGIQEVWVQPTHIINGIENDLMKEDVLAYQKDFKKIAFGSPLLSEDIDYKALVLAMVNILQANIQESDTAIIFMGHGSTHYSNSTYAALDYRFKEMGYSNIYIGTVEAYPSLDTIIKILEKEKYKKIVLTPLMLVAGDHAKNDMAGEEDSWKRILENKGYQVECLIKGLGEYIQIREIFINHLKKLEKVY